MNAGAHGNGWNNAATGAGGTSGILDARDCRTVQVFGNVSAGTTLTIQLSQDGTNFYDATVPAPQVLGGAGNFAFTFDNAATFVRLKSSAGVTATITLAGR